MGLGKNLLHIIGVAFLLGFCVVAQAQESVKGNSEQPKPSVQPNPAGNGVNNPNLTVPPIIRPIDDYAVPPPRPRRRRLTAADSARLAARKDSLLRAAAGAIATTPATINPTGTRTDTVVPTPAVQPTQTAAPEVPVLQNSDNPFDILRGATTTTDSAIQTPQKNIEPSSSVLMDKKVYSKNFLFWIFLITLALMALVIANARAMISNSFSAISSDNALRLINKESFGWSNIIYLALYILFWINAGIFAFLLLSHYGVKSAYSQSLTLLACIGGVALTFFLKHLILYIIAKVFPIEKEIKTYNFIILTAGILLGLILMPLNIFIAYTSAGLNEMFIYLTFGVIAVVYLVRSLRSLTIASPYMMENKFHFLLYLCTVEIAPVMVVAKLIMIISAIK